jgi:hypothetical protein
MNSRFLLRKEIEMVQAVSVRDVETSRHVHKPVGDASLGPPNWRTNYFGKKSDGQLKNVPQAFRLDMPAEKVVKPHFHAVDQYQVFVSGTGNLGRNPAPTLCVHYVDHHTGYGPIVAGMGGFSYFTFRARSDSGAVYLEDPGFRERLKPTKKRHHNVGNIVLSIGPVMSTREAVREDPVIDAEADGLHSVLLRAGAGMTVSCPNPKGSGGQFVFIVNGDLVVNGSPYPLYSIIWIDAGDPALQAQAGPNGVEALVLQFPEAVAE